MGDISPEQCIAARSMLRWLQKDLARESRVGVQTILLFERGKTVPKKSTLLLLRIALERAGIEFTDADGREGITWRKRP